MSLLTKRARLPIFLAYLWIDLMENTKLVYKYFWGVIFLLIVLATKKKPLVVSSIFGIAWLSKINILPQHFAKRVLSYKLKSVYWIGLRSENRMKLERAFRPMRGGTRTQPANRKEGIWTSGLRHQVQNKGKQTNRSCKSKLESGPVSSKSIFRLQPVEHVMV